MDSSLLKKHKNREKRALRVRSRVRNVPERLRLCVVKTNAHVHTQLIDDDKGITLASTSTLAKEFRGGEFGRKNKAAAKALGMKMAQLALAKDIKSVVLDRGSHKYHGVIAAFAEGAREGGLVL